MNTADILNVRYQSFGIEDGIEQAAEIIIYRIIRQSFNNIFKHAESSEIFVKLLREENRLSITVDITARVFRLISCFTSRSAGSLQPDASFRDILLQTSQSYQ